MLHVDTKRLPLLKNETKQQTIEYLFVGIDDFSRIDKLLFSDRICTMTGTAITQHRIYLLCQ